MIFDFVPICQAISTSRRLSEDLKSYESFLFQSRISQIFQNKKRFNLFLFEKEGRDV